MKNKITLFLLILTLLLSACAANTEVLPESTQAPAVTEPQPTAVLQEKTNLVVFAAGSLIIPLHEVEEAFEAKYPHIDLYTEYHGSIQVIRHVTEMYDAIDVVVTADSKLVPMLMYPVNVPETGLPYADWYINFATNKLALAYTDKSAYTEEINAENWVEILSRPDVIYGLSDPRFDAAGYRSLMAFALQEDYLGEYGLFKTMFKDQFQTPVTIFREDDSAVISIPEILDTKTGGHVLMRGASMQLIALLESGDIDYAFEYESVIKQHDLGMVELDDMVNLGSEDYLDLYDNVEVAIDFQRFQSVDPQFFGEPIKYGITIPSNTEHQEAAELYVAFLLSDEGRAILEGNQHPMFDVLTADGFDHIPNILQPLCVPEEQ